MRKIQFHYLIKMFTSPFKISFLNFVAGYKTKYFKSAENFRNYKTSLVRSTLQREKIFTVKSEIRMNLAHAGIRHNVIDYVYFPYTTKLYLSFNHSPVWVLLSKNVLDVSTVIVAKVPSVI